MDSRFAGSCDLLYSAPVAALQALTARWDLRPQCPPVYDQGQLGSCTANSIGAAIEFEQMKQKLADVFVPSRLSSTSTNG